MQIYTNIKIALAIKWNHMIATFNHLKQTKTVYKNKLKYIY